MRLEKRASLCERGADLALEDPAEEAARREPKEREGTVGAVASTLTLGDERRSVLTGDGVVNRDGGREVSGEGGSVSESSL